MNTKPQSSPNPVEEAELRARLLQMTLWCVIGCAVGISGLVGFQAPRLLPPILESWATLVVALVFQALPFLILGVVLSGLIHVFVPQTWFLQLRRLPRVALIPGLAGAGLLLPGCECSSVPVANSLIQRGLPAAAAYAFMLASPAINPVVLIATYLAFPANPTMPWARLVAGILAACAVGTLCHWFHLEPHGEHDQHHADCAVHDHADHHVDCAVHDHKSVRSVAEHVVDDTAQAAGFLVIGAMLAAVIKVSVPGDLMATFAGNAVLAVSIMALAAVIMSVCSESDAFIAASFTAMPPPAQLVFLVVGPMIDLKLMAMQWGLWGGRFALVFAPITLLCAVAAGVLVGWLWW